MDWLGDVGGIGDVISFAILLIFGGFLEFNFQISTIESLYSIKACTMGGEEVESSQESSVDVADFMKFEGGIQNVEIEDLDKESVHDNSEQCHEDEKYREHLDEGHDSKKNEFNMDDLICDFELNIFQKGLIYVIANMYPNMNLVKFFGSMPFGEKKLIEVQESIDKG